MEPKNATPPKTTTPEPEPEPELIPKDKELCLVEVVDLRTSRRRCQTPQKSVGEVVDIRKAEEV